MGECRGGAIRDFVDARMKVVDGLPMWPDLIRSFAGHDELARWYVNDQGGCCRKAGSWREAPSGMRATAGTAPKKNERPKGRSLSACARANAGQDCASGDRTMQL